VLDYTSIVGEYVISVARNYEMYFDLCSFPPWIEVGSAKSPEFKCKINPFIKCKYDKQLFKKN
jgi:hypothetical protein